ncbi:MAG: hypothetical protein ACTSXU_03985, partial [Promethearchaeota archaeon]
MLHQCPYCGSKDLKEEDDRSKPPISFIPVMIYPKKYTCKKCRKSFSKEEMENPQSIGEATEEIQEEEVEESPEEETQAQEPEPVQAEPPLDYQPTFAKVDSETQSPGTSSFASSSSGGFSSVKSEGEPENKKSYMEIMKEKQQFQAQQFQSTTKTAKIPAKTPAKPASVRKPVKRFAKPPAKPVAKPPAKPVAKPPAKPVAKPSTSNTTSQLPPLDDLQPLPDLPTLGGSGSTIPRPPSPVAKAPAPKVPAPRPPSPVAKAPAPKVPAPRPPSPVAKAPAP